MKNSDPSIAFTFYSLQGNVSKCIIPFKKTKQNITPSRLFNSDINSFFPGISIDVLLYCEIRETRKLKQYFIYIFFKKDRVYPHFAGHQQCVILDSPSL